MTAAQACLGIDLGSTTVKYVLLDGGGAVLAHAYERHQSSVAGTLQRLLEPLAGGAGRLPLRLALTGSSALSLATGLGVPFVQEVMAASAYLKSQPLTVDASIELGGEDAKIIYLTSGVELRMNEACAGGTGAFIDQMAALLGTDPAGLNALAARARASHPIASRCGVFAKTDVVALLNQGVPREDIARSIFEAVAEQAVGGLAQGRELTGNLAFMGGPLGFLPQLREAFLRRLGDKVRPVPLPHVEYAIAHGAALIAMDSAGPCVDLRQILARLPAAAAALRQASLPPLFASMDELRAFRERHRRAEVEIHPLGEAQGDLFLGIDLGSTTVKYALIDREGRIYATFYQGNGGRPLEALLPSVGRLWESIPEGARLRAICATGYGADLARAALNAQFTEVETLAHERAALCFDPEISYVIDIGGQDMKCIRVERGIITGIHLNEACSSGCGSFLETFAGNLSLSLPDFIARALAARAPCDLGTRCTVFMNSKVKQAQRDGASLEDLAAGLCLSIVRNALYKVLRMRDPRELGTHVLVQGGTFLNDAILRAFEQHTGLEVIRPSIAGLMGAFGAALLACERTTGDTPLPDRAQCCLDLTAVRERSMRCRGCHNHCALTVLTFPSGQRHLQGNRCDFAARMERGAKAQGFYEWKQELLFGREPLPADRAPNGTIGMARVLNVFEHYPYWHRLFTDLGFRLELSPPSSKEIAALGSATIPSQSLCLPAKLAHGHVVWLARQGVGQIFMPCVPREIKIFPEAIDSYACPVVGGYPEALRLNVERQFPRLKVHTPFLDVAKDATVERALLAIFPFLQARRVRAAIRAARAALDEYRGRLAAEGQRLLDEARERKVPLIVLAGHPYHVDPLLNHGIPALIASMGALVVSEDAVCGLAAHAPRLDVINQWAFHSRVYRAAQFAAEHPEAQLVQLVSFGCGVDAIVSEQARQVLEAQGKIYTMLKVDEGDTLGAARIRLRSLLCAIAATPKAAPAVAQSAPPSPPDPADRGKVIYMPQMAPIHFPIIAAALRSRGYEVRLLEEVSDSDIELGLRHVNNDACYPAIVVIGQLLGQLQSGAIDPDRSALLLAQTCGPCRATNYTALLKWALQDLGLSRVPVVTLSSHRLAEDTQRLRLGITGVRRLAVAVLYGDLLQKLYLYTHTYEAHEGEAYATLRRLGRRCAESITRISAFRRMVQEIVDAFAAIELRLEPRPRVGVVGEILLKYHDKANGGLCERIIAEGAEPVIGEISSFVLYCLYDSIYQARHFKGSKLDASGSWWILSRIEHRRQIMMGVLRRSRFSGLTPFRAYQRALGDLVSTGQQAGEGWLLTAEMVDFIENGITNVLCVQPFACLPNHITGKGVMREIRARYPGANLCSLDFEAGTSQANVMNRLKLFLAQAREGAARAALGEIHFRGD
ncbi:MAG: acyl-CoA dehydratase activase-related protein [Succinivibrionaceae bacterium]|nr:acyl-CoA dehydratase activase-related protein [Succinivibrionaceae bacterium]